MTYVRIKRSLKKQGTGNRQLLEPEKVSGLILLSSFLYFQFWLYSL